MVYICRKDPVHTPSSPHTPQRELTVNVAFQLGLPLVLVTSCTNKMASAKDVKKDETGS